MFAPRSRYFAARRFEPADDGSLPFKGVRPRVIGAATPVLEHTLQPGQRFDALGLHYYNDPRHWWRILDANPDVLCAAQLEIVGLPPLPRAAGVAPPAQGDSDDLGDIVLVPRAAEGGR